MIFGGGRQLEGRVQNPGPKSPTMLLVKPQEWNGGKTHKAPLKTNWALAKDRKLSYPDTVRS